MSRQLRRNEARRVKKQKIILVDLTKFETGTLAETNFQHQSCYANRLNSCEGPISSEHYISKSILKHFPKISSSGIPWLKDLKKDIPYQTLCSKCLCKRHNNFLSPLDDAAGLIFDKIVSFATDKREITKIPGRILERWMLKVLFGLIATEKIATQDKKYTKNDLDLTWLNVLYGISDFPEGTGLYINYKVGDKLNYSKKITLAPAFLNEKICGITVELAGFKFILSLTQKELAFDKNHPDFLYAIHHPKKFIKTTIPHELHFIW